MKKALNLEVNHIAQASALEGWIVLPNQGEYEKATDYLAQALFCNNQRTGTLYCNLGFAIMSWVTMIRHCTTTI